MNRPIPSKIRFQLKHELLAILGLSFLLIIIIVIPPLSALRIILGVPYVLFFPGYVLVSALFPGKGDLEGIERLGLSLALSIAVLPLMGLALNYTPFGITLLSTLVSATLFLLVCIAVAYVRRGRVPVADRYVVLFELDIAGWRAGGLLDRSLTAALAVSILLAVGTFLCVLAKPEVGERFTEFYVVGRSGMAEGYPTEVIAGEPIALRLGVVNREHEDVQYRLEKDVDGQEVEQIAQIQLAHEQEWEEPFTFALQQPGSDQKVSFLLYKEGEDGPYRELHLWLDVLPVGAEAPGATVSAPAVPIVPPTATPAVSSTAEVAPSATSTETAAPAPTSCPTPSPTSTPPAAPEGRVVHVVQPGETLSAISRQYGVSVEAIVYVNGIEDPSLIEVGQELVIPAPDEILPH